MNEEAKVKAKKTADEKLLEIEQKIHKLQLEKQKLKQKKESDERKKRNHALILFGSTILAQLDDETKQQVINGTDDYIVAFAKRFKKYENHGQL